MAFPMKKNPLMPPPGKKPDLVVAIGAGKPKDDADMPPKAADAPDPAAMPGAPKDDPDDDGDDDKMDPSKALVSHADENCGNCTNYDPSTGDCEKVSGTYAPDDRCYSGYQPMSSGTDEADMGAAGPAAMIAMGGAPPAGAGQ